MGFYYALEKARFDRAWSKLRKEYQQVGMNEESIQNLYEYDWAVFCSQRKYENRTRPLPDEFIRDDGSENSLLFRQADTLTTTFSEEDLPGRYAWIKTIEDPHLSVALKQLSKCDLELLTLLVIDEYHQRDLVLKFHCSQNAISKKFLRIKKILKKTSK